MFAEKLVGQQLASYTIGNCISVGGMGSIHYAHGPAVDESLAIKVLRPEYSTQGEYRQRFEREAYLLMTLDHPNILPVYDYGQADGLLYLVMRLVRGPSLFEMQTRRRFSPHSAAQILDSVANALDYAHDHNVIHRDIKPGNILIEARTTGNHVYLADFGLSKVKSDVNLTTRGTSLGTPQYMSPEQVMDYPLDRRSDVYSLGLVIYEMLLGRLPYYAATPQEVAYKHVKEQPPLPRHLSSTFPPALEEVLMKSLAKNVRDRYTTAGEFNQAFKATLAKLSPVATKEDYWVGPPNLTF